MSRFACFKIEVLSTYLGVQDGVTDVEVVVAAEGWAETEVEKSLPHTKTTVRRHRSIDDSGIQRVGFGLRTKRGVASGCRRAWYISTLVFYVQQHPSIKTLFFSCVARSSAAVTPDTDVQRLNLSHRNWSVPRKQVPSEGITGQAAGSAPSLTSSPLRMPRTALRLKRCPGRWSRSSGPLPTTAGQVALRHVWKRT